MPTERMLLRNENAVICSAGPIEGAVAPLGDYMRPIEIGTPTHFITATAADRRAPIFEGISRDGSVR